jgi:Kdo2-lipid IVA lauroyltransferase/acyltransferase
MLSLLFYILPRLPLTFIHHVGAAAGFLAYWLSASYRRKLNFQLDAAGLNTASVRQASVIEAGKMALETPWVWGQEQAKLDRYVVHDPSVAQVQSAVKGSPVIYLTPHLGGFEVAGRAIAQLAPMTVMFKPPKRADFGDIVLAARARGSMKTVPANMSGVRQLFKALKRSESIGILPDQVPTDGDGVWAPFFGKPAYTMTLQSKLAQSANAAVVMVACERLPAAKGWCLHMKLLTTLPDPEPLNREIEALIRTMPTQYLWGYNRFKTAGKTPEKNVQNAE